ncbi:hypothetical protein [Bifidobacterium sp. SO1]|uniref:hypothetical protein n=1 Tax=Bifidobacterium sp. SO1 TaxID=2809029 RepID=UPI001BDCB500|nr:hypothetical protein [Bifidobacterium sp. SO1]MBT1161781.1 hypothetical protein [Bifidobacterium sp. SO1]
MKRLLPAAALALALVLALTACTPKTAPTSPDSTNAGRSSQSMRKPATAPETTVTAADLRRAETLEHAMRDWGTDPTIRPATLKGLNAADMLQKIKGTIPETNPIKNLASPALLSEDHGPDAPSPICRDNPDSMTCSGIPSARQWLAHEAWSYGAKWTDGPAAVRQGDRILVTGTVRAVLLQDDDTFAAGDWHAITPAWKDYEIRDLITMKNGKAIRIEHGNADPWWIDPWLREWDRSMPEGVGSGERMAIPVKGAYDMNLHHDGMGRILKGPATQADLDGKVDWSLWSDIPMASVGGGCQNPGYCD